MRSADIWGRRYRDINSWEHYLTDNGFKVVKVFLNLSKEEQRIRFMKRLDLPEKNWKFSAADVRERRRWDDYQRAFSETLSATSTEWAPWYVVPADRKWFARVCAAAVLVPTLMDIDPHYPVVGEEARKDLRAARRELEAEAPEGAPADPYAAGHRVPDAGGERHRSRRTEKRRRAAAATRRAGKGKRNSSPDAAPAPTPPP